MAPRKRARKRPKSNKRPSATVRPYMHACNHSSPLHQQSSSPFISARSHYLVVPLAPRRRRRSIHTLALAVPPLSIAANEIRLRGSAALRRCRGCFKHFGLPRRVLVLCHRAGNLQKWQARASRSTRYKKTTMTTGPAQKSTTAS